MSSASQQAVRRVLAQTLKSAKPKPRAKPTPSAYLLYTQEKRAELTKSNAMFNAMEAKDKMKHLASMWRGLGDADKVRYQSHAAAAKARAPPPPPVEDGAEASFPLEIKNDTAMKKLTKEIADEAAQAILAELRAGNSVSVGKEGKLSRQGEPNAKGTMTISFKPSVARKKMAT